jgi:hypothetical protein
MKKFIGPLRALTLAACIGFIATGVSAQDDGAKTTKLRYKSISKWNIQLPSETFSPINGAIPVAQGFATEIDGTALAVDVNGDGKTDEKAKGTAGMITLKGGTGGLPHDYSLRLVNEGGWKWASSGALEGKVAGTKVAIIDQNNNGRFDDFGADAIVVGKTDAASFLSKIINVNGTLYEIEITEDGSELAYKPYMGKAGMLNLLADFESKGKLTAAVVRNENGDYSFELSDAKRGMLIPEGLYSIVSGKVEMGKESCLVKTGECKPIRVSADEPSVFAWGGPITAKFDYTREGEEVTFSPQSLWFFGKAGEEYHNWVPDGAPPKFIIKDEKGREITTAKFGGC